MAIAILIEFYRIWMINNFLSQPIRDLLRIFLMMCMYGLMLNVSNMSGDVFLNFTLLCIVDLLSVGFFALLVDRAGRRILLVGVTALGGVACTATILPVLLGGSSK